MRVGLDARDALRRESGISTLTTFLCRALAEIESDDEFWLYLDSYDGQGPSNPGLVSGQSFHTSVLPGSGQMWKQVRLPLALRRDKIDVFHSMTSTIPLARPCPTVVTVCDLFFEAHPELAPAKTRFKMRRLFSYAARHADRVIAISETTKRDLMRFYGTPEDRISVIYPGLNPFYRRLDPVKDGEKSKAVLSEYGISRPFLLHVGGMTENRNIGGLLDALAKLKKAGSRPKLVLVGRSFWGFDLKTELAKRLLCDDVVEIKYAPNEDLRVLYNEADILLLPSLYEGFGLPVLEAMAAGCPVICARSSSLPEVGGDAVLYFDPDEIHELSHRMRELLDSESLRGDLRLKGKIQSRKFSWKETARRTWEILSGLTDY